VTLYYMLVNVAWVREALRLSGSGLWFDIQPISAGVFGVAAGAAVMVLVSLLKRRTSPVSVSGQAVSGGPSIHL
jgi:cation/acetate symporter